MIRTSRRGFLAAALPGLLLLPCAGLLAAGGEGDHAQVPHRPRDTAAYMRMLEREERARYQKPEEVVEALGLRPGMDVADIGAGSGYFTRRIAPRVAPGGVVYALDVEKAFLERIAEEAAGLGFENITTVLTPPDRPALPDGSVDLVLFVNTWHHIANPGGYAAELRRLLRPGGRVAHIDWAKKKTPLGPPMKHRLSRDTLTRQMEEAGFGLRSQHFFLPYHYFLVFEMAADGGRE